MFSGGQWEDGYKEVVAALRKLLLRNASYGLGCDFVTASQLTKNYISNVAGDGERHAPVWCDRVVSEGSHK